MRGPTAPGPSGRTIPWIPEAIQCHKEGQQQGGNRREAAAAPTGNYTAVDLPSELLRGKEGKPPMVIHLEVPGYCVVAAQKSAGATGEETR